MTHFAFLCLGLGIGFAIGTWWMDQVLKRAEAFWHGALAFWAAKVSELQDQVNDLKAHDGRDEADFWKDP